MTFKIEFKFQFNWVPCVYLATLRRKEAFHLNLSGYLAVTDRSPQLWCHIRDSWHVVIRYLLRRDSCGGCCGRVVFSLWGEPSCPQHLIPPFLPPSLICGPTVCYLPPSPRTQLGPLDLQGACSYPLYYSLRASIIYTITLKR